MLSPLVSWIFSPSSSSSSSSEQEESLDINTDENNQKDNVEDDENDHYLSSCDVDDTIPVALAVSNASPSVTVAFPADDKRNNNATTAAATTVVTRSRGQRTAKYSGMVRQYQRLWTKQDEMELLKGYLEYIKQHRRATTSLQNDVASLYDQVRRKLNVDFNRNQLVEKLRRLKRKHKLALDKGKEKEVLFKNPQEQAIFKISHKIWGNDIDITDQDVLDGDESERTPESQDLVGNVKVKIEQDDNSDEIDNRVPKRARLITDEVNRSNEQNNNDTSNSIQGFIEDTMRSCFPPLLKELLDEAQEEPLELATIPMLACPGEMDDEQRRKHRIFELEVYLKRVELLQEHIKAKLEELRSR